MYDIKLEWNKWQLFTGLDTKQSYLFYHIPSTSLHVFTREDCWWNWKLKEQTEEEILYKSWYSIPDKTNLQWNYTVSIFGAFESKLLHFRKCFFLHNLPWPRACVMKLIMAVINGHRTVVRRNRLSQIIYVLIIFFIVNARC